MIKQTVVAVALCAATITGASALEDRNNISLLYTDNGDYFTGNVVDNFDLSNQGSLAVDGRNGIIEYGASVNEDNIQSVNIGGVLPLGNLGLVAGFETDSNQKISDLNDYYGVVYEAGRIEARYTYQDLAEDHKVSGRLYLSPKFAVQAGVQFDEWDNVGEDSTYTVGLSYKF